MARSKRAVPDLPAQLDQLETHHGTDKILLFTRTHALPALDSNGVRALVRLGHAREGRATRRPIARAWRPSPSTAGAILPG